jgi:hypothetical protein
VRKQYLPLVFGLKIACFEVKIELEHFKVENAQAAYARSAAARPADVGETYFRR